MYQRTFKPIRGKAPSRGSSAFPSDASSYEHYVDTCAKEAPEEWTGSCTNSECSLHQLSPYIGKLKSAIARDLLIRYSQPGDLVVDQFCGAGTIPLEATRLARRVFAADISPYAKVLTQAKLSAPPCESAAIKRLETVLALASRLQDPDLRRVPPWVRQFFHPQTLKEVLRFFETCTSEKDYFLMACTLGILHHQRPGFLSFPSSHLVPYLRDKRFPRPDFPELYEYRPLAPRMRAKIARAFKRVCEPEKTSTWVIRRSSIERLTFPAKFDCLVTSPPYMNALDYGRDNRLRLWFLDPLQERRVDNGATKNSSDFGRAAMALARGVERSLMKKGYCVLVVGERVTRSGDSHPARVLSEIFKAHAPSMDLKSVVVDRIPDIRRARRGYASTKTEHILVFRKR